MGSVSEFIRGGGSLRDDPAFLRELVANTTEGLLTIDADSVIVFANPGIERILGYEPDELVGSSKMEIIPERLRSAHADGLAQYLRTGEKHIDWTGVEFPALHKDGHEVPVSVSLREHEYRGERVFTGVFTDVSERKRREEALRRQKAELEEFADVLSHDLRNPLTVAEAHLSFAREERDDEALEKVDASLERIDQIIEDTLSRARHGADEAAIEPVTLREVATAAWDTVATREASLRTPDSTWSVHADPGRLRQLLENLFRNAVEHGGRDVTVRVGVLDDGDGFYVADDGVGFPESVTSRADGPVDGRYGLHIVGTIAREHGWSVTFTEARDGGARIDFRDALVFDAVSS